MIELNMEDFSEKWTYSLIPRTMAPTQFLLSDEQERRYLVLASSGTQEKKINVQYILGREVHNNQSKVIEPC